MRTLCSWTTAIVLAWPAIASAQDLASARRFVEGLYRAYHGDGPDYLGRGANKVFSDRILQLLRRDAALTPKGEVGALDGDPICDCQDFEISRVRIDVRPAANGAAQAVARFRNAGTATTIRLDLIATPGGWRVDNVHSASTPDLAAYLRRHAGGR